ncbi:MAG: K(+)-transporting ATPase subunit C [Dehalococcoidia bacterium]
MNQSITRELRPLVGSFVTLLLITAVAYPLLVTGVAQLAFPARANGSIVTAGGKDVGSALIGQSFKADAYIQGRPSAAGDGYDASASSGSNLGPTSQKLIDRVIKDAHAFRAANGLPADALLPADAVTASASGLDPDVSPATALLQAPRVAKARGVHEAAVRELILAQSERPILGFFGEARVNVLHVNLALDREFPRQ